MAARDSDAGEALNGWDAPIAAARSAPETGHWLLVSRLSPRAFVPHRLGA